MGGEIDYESEVNKGTSFFFEIPIGIPSSAASQVHIPDIHSTDQENDHDDDDDDIDLTIRN
jgi:hypothetical protein